MSQLLSKKDFKIIGKSIKNPSKIIVELDVETLKRLIGTKKRVCLIPQNETLREYIHSKEINNPDNISGVYENITDLLASLK